MSFTFEHLPKRLLGNRGGGLLVHCWPREAAGPSWAKVTRPSSLTQLGKVKRSRKDFQISVLARVTRDCFSSPDLYELCQMLV